MLPLPVVSKKKGTSARPMMILRMKYAILERSSGKRSGERDIKRAESNSDKNNHLIINFSNFNGLWIFLFVISKDPVNANSSKLKPRINSALSMNILRVLHA